MIYADLLAANYSYSYEYICDMDALLFLKFIRCIQKRHAETTLMQAHTAAMVNANQEAWDDFKISLGFAPQLSDLALAAQKNDPETDMKQFNELKTFLGQ